METPVGAKPANRQVDRSRVVAVFNGTDIAQALGAGTPIVIGMVRLPVPKELCAVRLTE